jgi:hypothetical protein
VAEEVDVVEEEVDVYRADGLVVVIEVAVIEVAVIEVAVIEVAMIEVAVLVEIGSKEAEAITKDLDITNSKEEGSPKVEGDTNREDISNNKTKATNKGFSKGLTNNRVAINKGVTINSKGELIKDRTVIEVRVGREVVVVAEVGEGVVDRDNNVN